MTFALVIYGKSNKTIDLQLSNQLWAIYDDSITIIKNNMETITESNEGFAWWTLRNFDIGDKNYE